MNREQLAPILRAAATIVEDSDILVMTSTRSCVDRTTHPPTGGFIPAQRTQHAASLTWLIPEPRQEVVMKRTRRLALQIKYATAIGALAAVATGCASATKSSSGSAGAGSSARTSASAGTSAGPTTTAPTSSTSPKTIPLPAPCTLLTVADVAPMFGTTALNTNPSTGPEKGVAQCSFNLTVGVQGKEVGIRTYTNFPDDDSYVFPSVGTTPVSGLGYPAVLSTTNNHGPNSSNNSTLTVKLGTNALEVHVEWYTNPVNIAFITKLTKTALSRL
jgi:hypothetical protein